MESKRKTVIGILAHVDAGKTTLIESILYKTGAIRNFGRVDHQDSFFDYDEQERDRGITIYSKEAHFSYQDVEVYIIDTPGHVDFSSEMERTLSILDMAVLVINGQDGVQAHTETIWKCLEYYHVPAVVFVNKMDITRLSKDELFYDVTKQLSSTCIDWQSDNRNEEISLSSDALLEEFEKEGSLSNDSVISSFYQRQFFPLLFGSALKVEGVDTLLDVIAKLSQDKKYPEEFGSRVYKITMDENHTRLTHMKITGGCLYAKQKLSDDEKVDQIRLYHSIRYTLLDKAEAGMVVAIKGLKQIEAGDGLGFEQDTGKPILNAYMDYHIVYPSDCDLLALNQACRIISEEDPSLQICIQENTHQIDVHIMGEMQMEVLQKRIFDECGISVGFTSGKIIYLETIQETTRGVGHFEPLRHFSEVQVRIEPVSRGKGIIIASETSSDQLSFNYQNAILSALRTKKHRGVLTGSQLTDVKITLTAGKGHLKHTQGGDFRQAATRAVRQALMKTTSILLEPYVQFSLKVPTESLSKALFDLENKKAKFEIKDSDGDMSQIQGRGSVKELAHYQNEVSAYTKGLGRFAYQMDGYDICMNQDEVINNMHYDPEGDLRNPSSSVFCANGSGFTVTWDKVDEYLGIDEDKKESTSIHSNKIRVDEDELKRIFASSTSNNRNPNKQKPEKKKIKEEKPRQIIHLHKCLIIDGYNMIFSWDIFKEYRQDELAISRQKLLDILYNYQGYTNEKMIVVFDGYRVKDNLGTDYRKNDMEVVYTHSNETADAYIERLVYENKNLYDMTVATSDGLIQNAIFAQGAKRMSAREFYQQIKYVNQQIDEQLEHRR